MTQTQPTIIIIVIIITTTTIIKTENPTEEEESDFQSYHINRFKCPFFYPKNHKTYKEPGKYDLKGKKINQQKLFLRADLLDKDFETTALKMLKELKKMWRR